MCSFFSLLSLRRVLCFAAATALGLVITVQESAHGQTSKDPCATQKAEVDKLEKWVSYDRSAKTRNLTTNLAKLAAANKSLKYCLAGMAKLEFDSGLDEPGSRADIPGETVCPHTKWWEAEPHCVPAGNTTVVVQYAESALSYAEAASSFTINFEAGHTYEFKYKILTDTENSAYVTYWVEDAADGSVVAGQRPD
jgi:hypothetical protein